LIKRINILSKRLADYEFNKKFWQTDRITISSDQEFAVEFDGEVINTKHAEFSVIPGLIKVCTN
jgi:diacylglycerol kinase family enzyme